MEVRTVLWSDSTSRGTSQSDPIGLSQAEAFRNSLADSVSFRFPSWLSLDWAPLLRRSCSALCQALRGREDMTWSFDARGKGQPGYSRAVEIDDL